MSRVRGFAPPVLLLVALFGAWELYVDLGHESALVLPAPHAVAQALVDNRSLLWSNFLTTAEEVVFGIVAGAGLGFALTVWMHFSRTMRRAAYPLAAASQAIPIPMIGPLFLVWLGFGLEAKLAVIALVTFFPVVVYTQNALDRVDVDLIKLMRSFGATRRQIFRFTELPSALPALFTGVKLAIVFSVLGAYLAETNGGDSGLGYLFNLEQNQLSMPLAFAAVAVMSAFAAALFAVLSLAERLALPWAFRSQGEPNP